MKKRRILAVMVGVMCLLSGCSKLSAPDESAVSIGKDGGITGTAVESLDKEYYDETELKTMIESEINAYKTSSGKDNIKLDKFSVDEQKAKLIIDYASAQDYANFNHVEFFVGKISEAQKSGVTFEGGFQSVEDGKVAKSGLTSSDVLKKDYQIVVMEEPVLVQVPGNILYTSDNVEVKGKSEAKIKSSGSEAAAEKQSETAKQEETDSETGMVLLFPESSNSGTSSKEVEIGKKLAYIIYELG